MIGAGMGLITTFAMPTGWWLVGRTPERMFSLARKQTFLAAVGDEIKFDADRSRHLPRARQPRGGRRDRRHHDEAAMNAALKIIAAGPGVTLQDAGRHGYLRYGVTAAGPMDRLAMATANRAVGAAPGATAIEVSLGGIEVTADGATLPVAHCRREFRRFHLMDSDCHRPCGWRSRRARSCASAPAPTAPGAISRSAAASMCRRCSAPTRRTRALRSAASTAARWRRATSCRCATSGAGEPGAAALTAPWLDRSDDPIRVILGPQDDYFSREQIETFCREAWTVSHRSDRMAYFLDGAPIAPANGLDIVSDGIVMGAIQVLGDGRPMVLMADRQVTGGYPKIATVIGPDQGRLAQMRPGSSVRFAVTTIDAAVAGAARRARDSGRADSVRAAGTKDPNAELLLGAILISGVSGGRIKSVRSSRESGDPCLEEFRIPAYAGMSGG